MINKTSTITLLIIVATFLFWNSAFIVKEGRQAIVTEFGKPMGEPITSAGIHFKMPFTQDVRYVDKRILSWDGFPNQIPTRDKKYIEVDTTARWKIIDVLKFIQTVQNENGAKARLDTILDGHTRDIISSHNLVEAVRDSNRIMEVMESKKQMIAQRKTDGEKLVDEEIMNEVELIEVGREKLSQMIVEKANKELEGLGIKLVDVQLRRISYEKSVEGKVYERMISERQRVAQKIRSIGKGEKANIEGRMERDLKQIESEAYKESQEIRGKAQAQATSIYAKTLSKNPDFFEFMRTLEAYQKTLGGKSRFILSTESEFLKYFK